MAAAEGHFKTIDDQIDEKLLQNRRVFLSDPIDSNSAKEIIKRLWYLELSEPGKPILMVISCPGGSVDAGFAIWDQIKMLTSPIVTLVTGMAASMGSVLSLVAPKGKRFATSNARIMIHQPSIHGVVQGQATDLNIHAEEILKTRSNLVQLYVDVTGKDVATIEKAIDRDKWFSAKEALEYGLIDQIVSSYQEIS